jgi:hypothetical protein
VQKEAPPEVHALGQWEPPTQQHAIRIIADLHFEGDDGQDLLWTCGRQRTGGAHVQTQRLTDSHDVRERIGGQHFAVRVDDELPHATGQTFPTGAQVLRNRIVDAKRIHFGTATEHVHTGLVEEEAAAAAPKVTGNAAAAAAAAGAATVENCRIEGRSRRHEAVTADSVGTREKNGHAGQPMQKRRANSIRQYTSRPRQNTSAQDLGPAEAERQAQAVPIASDAGAAAAAAFVVGAAAAPETAKVDMEPRLTTNEEKTKAHVHQISN